MNKLNTHQDAGRDQDTDRIAVFLKQAWPPVTGHPGASLERDLWPAMLNRLDHNTAVSRWDKALIAAALAWLLICPTSIPVLFYYL